MRLSVRTKLLAGFGAVVVLLLVVSAFSVLKMSDLNKDTTYLSENVAPSLQLIGEANAIQSDFRVAQLEHVIAEPRSGAIKTAEETIADESADMDAALEGYEKMVSNDEDRALYESVTQGSARYKELSAPFLAHSRAGRPEQAMAALSGETAEVFSKLSDDMIDWADYNEKLSDEYAESAAAKFASGRNFAIALSLVAVGIALAIALLLSRKIVTGFNQMLVAAKGISQGQLEQDVSARSQDELGETAQAFGEMIEYLRATARAAKPSAPVT